MSKKHHSTGRKLPQRFLQQAIHKLLRKKSTKFYSPKTVVQKLGVKNSKDSVHAALEVLYSKGKVLKNDVGKYAYNRTAKTNRRSNKRLMQGKIQIIASGAAFVMIEGLDKDVYVPNRGVLNALNGDTVEVDIKESYRDRRPEGVVTSVIKRNRTSFIGVFQKHKKYALVYVNDGKVELEVKVMPEYFGDAADGAAVVVEVYEFGENKKHPALGRIKATINQDDRNDFEMNSILLANGFDLEFSDEVLQETAKLSDHITPKDLEERLDLREKDVITIDPVDAKDFDDALSYEVLAGGNIRIGVHIADVTHYVLPGTALDKEAYNRATSVYLVDRVCPMLPERISNELCSLRPNEDKFAFSALLTFDDSLKVIDIWLGKTLIHSKRRFTYEEAQEVLDQGVGDFAHELKAMNAIAKSLKKKRFKQGSIDFESDEVRFVLDEAQKPIDVKKKIRGDSHKLVEEFMLLANRSAAKYVAKKAKNEIPNVYRIHDKPDPEKLATLALLAKEFGISLRLDTPKNITQSLNSLSKKTEGTNLINILRPMAIRSMAKAVYSSENIGHFGLGFEFYTHFTSPIRRYSDVLVHRILYKNLSADYRMKKEDLEDMCLHISYKERQAINAERESIKYKQVEYLAERIGEELEGSIRNIIDRGIFVELTKSQSDGLIPFESFKEPFDIEASQIKAIGRRSGVILRLGDHIKIKVVEADLERRQVEFAFVSKVDS